MNLPTEYQQYIHLSRYARWLEDKGRRETWSETVERFITFITTHLAENFNNPVTQKDLKRIHEAVLNLEVMPSMRALMTAGPALERDHIAGYNCAYIEKKNNTVWGPRSGIMYIYIYKQRKENNRS